MGRVDEHDCQADIKGVHFLDCGLPIFDFNWAFPIGNGDNLASPSLLRGKVVGLSLNTNYQSVNG
jgi:hypothetical protein